MRPPAAPAEGAPLTALRRIAESYGTPTYAYDLERLGERVSRLLATLPPGVELLYSLKANPSLGLCVCMARWGVGADVASAGELLTAVEAGFPDERISVSGPYKSAELRGLLHAHPDAWVSVDSLSELACLGDPEPARRLLLRLRPDFTPAAAIAAGPDSRFGVPWDELRAAAERLRAAGPRLAGFHVYAGSQILDARAAAGDLDCALELSLRAADLLGVTPETINLGGGFGVPYAPGEEELALEPIARTIERLRERAAPAKLVLELGRYLVAPAGWYLTRVVGTTSRAGRPAAVVDGGIHQRADLCQLGLPARSSPPLVLSAASGGPLTATDVLGCLCLPGDVLAEAQPLPELPPGTLLAFANAGAYGLSASPNAFLSHPPPAEVAFDGDAEWLLRPRRSARTLLEGQNRPAALEVGAASGEA